ncbi:pyridoxamine 5'-phosphate oxidase family protein [Amycolatopsis sp. K13G38]|uniref:Pyridoxamine 5'-phosphate oxidase family protein n=1 Tax=Amycolatopsis acididurans TaxID=2724524 RepID=A0ABX1JD54_9PSEU|nr:pyridoxamine 5'-phosphate oxidase family protein [Amycolatopsis acididurans]NKQ57593.1 pyridoxamine 5'-phosphate oxidase family protein [Amycolatopsis acididurans]
MPTPSYDLPAGECVRLAQSKEVGRVVYTEAGQPTVRLVSFVIVDDDVVICEQPRRWTDGVQGSVVAFEVDHLNSATNTGWCVVIVGRARRADTAGRAAEREGEHRADPSCEPPCAIAMTHVSGQRLRLTPPKGDTGRDEFR